MVAINLNKLTYFVLGITPSDLQMFPFYPQTTYEIGIIAFIIPIL